MLLSPPARGYLVSPMSAPERSSDSLAHWPRTLGLALLLLAGSTLAQPNPPSMRCASATKSLRRSASSRRRPPTPRPSCKQEIAAIGEDRRKLSQSLIDGAGRLRDTEDRIAETESRLKPLDDSERRLRRSLEGRRATIAEVLAALQRIGRHPPPAIMVRPEDALQSVRTAIMLGAVLPEMRVKAEALASDLADLLRIRKEIADEKDRLVRDVAALTEDRQRISLLISERQKQQSSTERALDAEQQNSLALARQVDNLKDLIGNVEKGLDSASRASRAADRAAEDKARDNRIDLAALNDPGRLTPAVAFASTRGRLPFPVNGSRIKDFGVPDSLGGTERAFPSPPGPPPRSPPPVIHGWFTRAPSAIMANS